MAPRLTGLRPGLCPTALLVYRWILARLRHQRFFSLDELNTAIRPLLTELNDRPYQRLPGSRHSVCEALDWPAMRALPAAPYTYSEWRERMVAFDYHVDVEQHYYSVPHAWSATRCGRDTRRRRWRSSSAGSVSPRMSARISAPVTPRSRNGESMRKNRATADAGASPRPDGR